MKFQSEIMACVTEGNQLKGVKPKMRGRKSKSIYWQGALKKEA
jgi:hypothetical protein